MAELIIKEELEKQKEALERDYKQKMEKMRQELERKNEEDRARLLQEIEELKQQVLTTPTKTDNSLCEDNDDDDLRKKSAYDLMQSIAYTPVTSIKRPNPLGKERDPSLQVTASPSDNDSPCSSPHHHRFLISSTPDTSPENRHCKTMIIQDERDEDTMDISIVEVPDSPVSPSTVEMGSTMLSQGDTASPEEEQEEEGGGEGSMDSRKVLSTPTVSTASIEACPTFAESTDGSQARLKQTEDNRDDKLQLLVREKREMASKLTEAERKARSLRNHLNDQEIHYKSEQRAICSRLDHLQEELFKKEVERGQARSNAFSAGTPEPVRQKRSQSASRSLRYTSRCIQVELPGFLLRGDGWNAYHVFEVQIMVGGDKWSVYKSYKQFKMFHEDITRRYSQLSVLSFPPSKWFGVKNRVFVEQRRSQLQLYMQSLMTLITTLPTCPLYEISSRHLSKDKLITFNSFFNDGNKNGL